MDMDRLKRDITRREGLRLDMYPDHLGYWTVGVGHNIQERGISHEVAMLMLEEDLDVALGELKQNLSWFDEMPETIQECLCDLAFNMGVPRLMQFRKTLANLRAMDWSAAADELLDSKYAAQVPNRAKEIAGLIRNA